MLKFNSFLNESDKLRKGLPHITDLKPDQFHALTQHGVIHAKVTEKTDGMAFEVGHDENGFYSRSSNSDKMRRSGDYYKAAKKKFGPNANPEISGKFDKIHQDFHKNKKLTSYLENHAEKNGGTSSLKGEIFHRPSGTHSEDGKHVHFVGTKYRTDHMGSTGKFVHHTELSPNHDPKHISRLGNEHYTFDHDSVDNHVSGFSVVDLHKKFKNLNHDVLASRKHADKPAKAKEQEKFHAIKQELHKRIAPVITKNKPKWGPETEGHVVHPTHIGAPRFKIVDSTFKSRKSEFGPKFENYLNEGGNIKIGGVSSVPVSLEKRSSKSNDFKKMLHGLNDAAAGKLYGKEGKGIDSGSIFAGSSPHYFNNKIKDSVLKRIKPSFGDIDVMVPHDSHEHLDKHLTPGKEFGNFKVHGVTKSKNQYSAIMKHKDGSHHQVDFEFKPFENNEPSHFAKWSQNSHLRDLSNGMKGSARNLLLSALTAAKGTGPGFVKKGDQHIYHSNIEKHSYSMTNGLRTRHVSTGESHEGLPVHKEAPKSGYITDVPKILSKLVGKTPKVGEIKDSEHFHGVAAFAAKHLSKDEKNKVMAKFKTTVLKTKFSKNEIDDKKQKRLILNHISGHFPHEVKKSLTEAKNFRVAMAAGRFNGPTIEHQKLIKKTLAQKADKHYVFVMGPETVDKTNAKDPMTVHEKVKILKQLHPKNADAFIPAIGDMKTGHKHVKGIRSPLHAMNWVYLKHKEHDNVHLNVVGGSGEEGIKGKDVGGSSDKYGSLVAKYNNTDFPKDEEDEKPDKRMKFATFKTTSNPRGKVSGSLVRNFAVEHDHKNPDHVAQFKKMLHSKTDSLTAQKLMKLIKDRSIKK